MKGGAITGLSIGYSTTVQEWDSNKKVRYLKEVVLYEVSLVTIPANHEAEIDSIKAAESIKTVRDFENWLQAEGFSARAATAIASKGFIAGSSDAEDTGEGDLHSCKDGQQGEPDSQLDLIEAIKGTNALIALVKNTL
jgi:hypothetical protein